MTLQLGISHFDLISLFKIGNVCTNDFISRYNLCSQTTSRNMSIKIFNQQQIYIYFLHTAIKTPNEPQESCVETGCSPTLVQGSHNQGQTFSNDEPNQVLDKAPFKENATTKSCFMHLLKIEFKFDNFVVLENYMTYLQLFRYSNHSY